MKSVFLAACLLGSVCSADAKTIVVLPGVDTLRQAMFFDAAEGDTVLLEPGTYVDTYTIRLKAGVVLTSRNGPIDTIVTKDPSSYGPAFYVIGVSPPPTIEGLTIAHGLQLTGDSGAGIVIRNASPIIQNNLIVANSAGGIEGQGGLGCGIGIEGGSPIIRHNTIVGNVCDYGAIDLYQSGALVEHNIIADNRRPPNGDGITCDGGSAIIRENLFWGNGRRNVSPTCPMPPDSSGNVTLDPQFCSPALYPKDGLTGDWRVEMTSPTSPGGPCSGWGAALGLCADATPAMRRSWGSVKALYR